MGRGKDLKKTLDKLTDSQRKQVKNDNTIVERQGKSDSERRHKGKE